ncbi:MAG: diacylglycerol kinase [Microbacteriaceae bacterium]|nr:diacylglycerol kinase [Microbacteriaceae bacterium]
MNSPRAAVIVNPVKLPLDELVDVLAELEAEHGLAPSLVLPTTVDEDGDAQARDALAEGVDRVVVAGGDGTVRLAAGELAGTGVPLGIVPAGTGNLLARNLGIDPEAPLRDHLHGALAGGTREIDLARAEIERPDGGHERVPFAVIAGIGVDAGMIEHTDEELKARIGWLAYLEGIARTLIGGPTFRARFRLGRGRTFGTRAAALLVGHCGELQGGMVLLPDAEIDDGRLDVLVMRPSGPTGWLELLSGVIAGSISKRSSLPFARRAHGDNRRLSYAQTETAVLRVDSSPEAFEVDGDIVGDIVAARFTVEPGALLVRAPGA